MVDADAVQAHLARHTRALRAADVGVRRDAEDSVHQMRVADGVLDGVAGQAVAGPGLDALGLLGLLGFSHDQPSTWMPMERAEPAIILAAASTS